MQNKTLDLVAIGECLVEFAEIDSGLFRQGYSGDVLNTLWMAHSLGLRTGLISSVGDDPFEGGLREILNNASIDQSAAPTVSGKSNGIYFVLHRGSGKTFHFMRKASAATHMFEQEHSQIDNVLRRSRFALFSSIPLAFVRDRDAMMTALRACREVTPIAFDINFRRALWPRPEELAIQVQENAALADFLFVSEEDDQALFGERVAERALANYSEMGYRKVIYRRGSQPTEAIIDGIRFSVPTIPNCPVLDTTGAGDAFNAGFIASHLHGQSWYDSIAFANATAASVLSTPGGRAIGVTKATIDEFLRNIHSEVRA